LARTVAEAVKELIFTLVPWAVTAYRFSPKVVGPQKDLCIDKLHLTGQNLGQVLK